MKIGKVSQTVLKRSMLKPLQFQREEAMFSPAIEEMCYGITCDSEEEILCTSTVVYGDEKELGVFALAQVMNDLATRGAEMVGASVHIMLPPYAYESRLKSMVECMEQSASQHDVQLLNVKAEVSPAVSKSVLYVTGLGKIKKGCLVQSEMAQAEEDIVLLKWIGLEGTFRILNEKEEELKQRFVPNFLNQLRQKREQLFSVKELEIAKEYQVSAMHQISSGGILAALWELAESADIGLAVELKKMSICQETVEICEFFHLNPYQLTSSGCVLIVTKQGEALVEKYQELGICATVIGRTTKDKAKVILGGEEKRFLDRPAPDELSKIYCSDNI